MSIDYAEMERQFLETLKADTGRALDEWMAAIAAEKLTHRNDIIDWLRRQGFMFSKASWLERIHNNGGKPIYDGTGPRPKARPRSPSAPRLVVVAASPQRHEITPPVIPPIAPAPVPASPPASSPITTAAASVNADPAALEALFSRAKAYRPLAAYVVAEIRKKVADAAVLARDGYLVFRLGDLDFALLSITAKELRLGLALRGQPATPLEAAKLPALRAAPPMSHMAVLTDARQVTPALLAAVAQAATAS